MEPGFSHTRSSADPRPGVRAPETFTGGRADPVEPEVLGADLGGVGGLANLGLSVAEAVAQGVDQEGAAHVGELPPELLDAVVVPGSVFDCIGRRCGYGGGFYDTYLPRTRPGTPWVGLAFEAQIVGELPCEPHDLPMTAVVTEARIIRPA